MLLMKSFDIVAEGSGPKPIMKTFENVQATAGGRIELYFMPIVNYPVVNAIEIQPGYFISVLIKVRGLLHLLPNPLPYWLVS